MDNNSGAWDFVNKHPLMSVTVVWAALSVVNTTVYSITSTVINIAKLKYKKSSKEAK